MFAFSVVGGFWQTRLHWNTGEWITGKSDKNNNQNGQQWFHILNIHKVKAWRRCIRCVFTMMELAHRAVREGWNELQIYWWPNPWNSHFRMREKTKNVRPVLSFLSLWKILLSMNFANEHRKANAFYYCEDSGLVLNKQLVC